MTGRPEVFIIESLDFEDEQANRFEGQIIKQILAFSGKTCLYYYIRTKRELDEVVDLWEESEYRYLHLSCHGNKNTMATTLDQIPISDLGDLLRPRLRKRRLFVSACGMTNNRLARALMPHSGCYSIIGPCKEIAFADAAILWASLYHVMFSADGTSMKRSVLKSTAQEVANMYRVSLRLFASDATSEEGYSTALFEPEHESQA